MFQVQVVGERIDLDTLAKLKITRLFIGNSNESGVIIFERKDPSSKIRDPKDNYFKVEWETTTGETFNINISPEEE